MIDADTAAWHVDNFVWLAREFGGEGAFEATRLVLPKPGFFQADGESGHQRALTIFVQVRNYCQMAGWAVDLVPDRNPLADTKTPVPLMLGRRRYALGTFANNKQRIQISYVPSLLERPQQLIATFAHELSHYLLATACHAPPCADDEHEFLTDLTAVFLGFGVFLANARFQFSTFSDGNLQGWSMQNSGYLPEADLIFALALFLRSRELDPAPAYECLKPHLAKLLRRALGAVTDHDLDRIRRALRTVESGPDDSVGPANVGAH